jgi:hypothetical protein
VGKVAVWLPLKGSVAIVHTDRKWREVLWGAGLRAYFVADLTRASWGCAYLPPWMAGMGHGALDGRLTVGSRTASAS